MGYHLMPGHSAFIGTLEDKISGKNIFSGVVTPDMFSRNVGGLLTSPGDVAPEGATYLVVLTVD
jgi:hypothetical protein